MFWAFLIPCAFTCAVETLVLFCFKDGKRRMLPQLVCNAVTNPTLHVLLAAGYFAIAQICGGEQPVLNALLLCALEVGVVFTEAVVAGLFYREPFVKRLKVSVIVNASSFLLGLCLQTPLEALLHVIIG